MEYKGHSVLVIGYGGHLEALHPGQDQSAPWWKRFLRFFLMTFDESMVYITGDRTGMALFKHLVTFRRKYPELADRIHVQLWGSIDSGNITQIKKLGLSEIVTVSGFVPREESDRKLHSCDVLLLLQESGKGGFRPLALPSKMFEYMRVKKPVLVISEESDCTDVMRKSGLGIICPHDDENAVADTIRTLILNKEELPQRYKADEAYIRSFGFDRKTDELVDVFKKVLAG